MRDTTSATIEMPTTAGMASKPDAPAALVETLVVGGCLSPKGTRPALARAPAVAGQSPD